MDEIGRLGLTLTGPAEARREIRDLTLATDAAAAMAPTGCW